MAKSLTGLAAIAVLAAVALSQSAVGAELDRPRHVHAHPRVAPAIYCGCCGCLRVTFDYHRELRSTYGTRFDPRNFDQTEPYYYFGRVRPYPRFWVERDGVAAPQ